MTGTPTLHQAHGRATLTLRRPDKRNRIEPDDLTTLIELCDEIDDHPDVHVVVIESSGPSWCSGYHLGALAEGAVSRHSFSDLCDRIEALAVPTIAAIHGNVHGGGTDLAIACDFRVGADGVLLAMPAAKIGLQYYASGLRRFVERIGPDATKRLFLTAETITTDELLRLGYLTEVVPPSELSARVDALSDAMAGLAPLATRRTKLAINQISAGNADLAAIQSAHIDTVRSAEHQEAMRALREKRPPIFRPT